MDILHEVKNTFRVTLIRKLSRWVGDENPVTKAAPFILNYREPGVAAAEHVELPDDALRLYLTMPEDAAAALRTCMREEFFLSEGMFRQLRAARDLLIPHLQPAVAA
jgi:hypothetical protein